MDRGYVKYWRKSLDHPLFKKPMIWHFWGYCLLKASHKDTECFLNGQVINVKKGSFVFGRKKAAEETGLTERQIRTALKHLEKLQNLTIETTNRYSVISIINWGDYQSQETKSDQQNDQLPTSQRPATDHIQECKEQKNISSGKSAVEFFAPEINGWDKTNIQKTIDGFISLRKTKQISSGVIESEFEYWSKYPDEIINKALTVYINGKYWEKTKGEKYLRGIIRGKNKEAEKSKANPMFKRAF